MPLVETSRNLPCRERRKFGEILYLKNKNKKLKKPPAMEPENP